jgi:DNA-directed RNA polymerase subunit N (RpoN/RPB10)
MAQIRLVYSPGSDWVGVYQDDDLQVQDHDLAPEQVLDAIGVEDYELVTIDFAQAGWRYLPESYSEVAKAVAKQWSPRDAKPDPSHIRVAYSTGSDWVGVYYDDELKTQDHDLMPEQVLDAIGVEDYEMVTIDFAQAGWKVLPERYSEVEKVVAKQAEPSEVTQS